MKKTAQKVMVFGVFDLLHPGHLNFLIQARELGDKLIVSIARDLNVFKIKGQRPVHGERQRLEALTLLPVVDKVVLGGLRDPWPHIVKEKPDGQTKIIIGTTSYATKEEAKSARAETTTEECPHKPSGQ